MKKRIYKSGILILGLCWIVGAQAQEFTEVKGEALQKMLLEITRVSEQIKTLECRFKQRKTISVLAETAEAEGMMYYQKADRMRWEYLKPDAYYFVMNGNKSVMKKNGETDRGGSARIFGEIAKMIMGSISGKKLVDEERFVSEYSGNKEIFRISLQPKNRRMLQMISLLVMEFDIKEHAIRSVEMWQGEDVTRIEFMEKKVNGALTEGLFSL